MELKPAKAISKLSFLTLMGLALLLICSIPMTSVVEVIDTSFTVSPGNKYDSYYHTTIFGKSVLNGEVIVEGEAINLTVYGYNAHQLDNIYVKEQYSFTVDPADDLYTFIFNNTEGRAESLVKFTLEEVWTSTIAMSSPLGLIAGLIGFFLFLAGLIALAVNRLKRRIEEVQQLGARVARQLVY